MTTDSQDIIQRLWGACDVADGLSKLNHPHGGFLRLDHVFPTVPSWRNQDYWSSIHRQINMVLKDAIVLISQPTPHINACYGDLMTLRAQALGAAGVVIDGCVRDLGEHRGLNFLLFAKSVGTTAGGEVCRPSEVEVPVRLDSDVQEALIKPGDYIIADLNGVVCLPQELAKRVLDIIPAIVVADQQCAEDSKAGQSVKEVFEEYRRR